ncbi:nucleotide exchange factor GrpE [Desulfobacula sp.]|uniref:nucleotide exchange factor GrpE n=1 Tax=Desulfobacula sp. TaxID=2593537 RepID=UPI002637A12D|nr:nucleotide exchange factor GrpE [Desulfobacula sp.]
MAKEKKKPLKETKPEGSPEKKAKEVNVKDKPEKSQKKNTSDKTVINELKEQLSDEKDRNLRLLAEFENFKKRKQRELDEFKKFANEAVFRQLLTVVDNLERAILSAKETSDEDGLLGGVRLTHKEVIKLFETFNVTPVEAENQLFDPNFHQAVNQEETDEVPENTVTTVLQKGYCLHGRLIRPAMVIVSKKLEKNEALKEN